MGLLYGLFGSSASIISSSTSSTSTSSLSSISQVCSCSDQSSNTSSDKNSLSHGVSSRSTTPSRPSDDSGPWAPYPKSAQLTPHYAFHPLTHKLAYLEKQRAAQAAKTNEEDISLLVFGGQRRKEARNGGLGTCEKEVRVVSSLLSLR